MIVAGAGIVGLACAWEIARRGIPVTVFDARDAAREASWAGAGMLSPGGEVESSRSPLAETAVRSAATYAEYVNALERATGIAIDYRLSGAIEIARNEDEAAALETRAAHQNEAGIRSEPRRHDGYYARYYPGDAIVDPRHVTAALLDACRSRGVRIHEHEPVTHIAPDGRCVHTTRGEYRDEGVVIAAGAWSGALYPRLRRTMPIRGHLVSWDLQPGFLAPILRHGHTYLFQRASGRLIAGSSTEDVGFDRTPDIRVIAGIEARAAELLPALRGQKTAESWNGLRPGIDSDRPAIGQISGVSVWMAFGHYRNGILLAPETARQIADSIDR